MAEGSGETVDLDTPQRGCCSTCGAGDVLLRVKIAADLAFEGEDTWKVKPIDACIAPIVSALQAGGVDMHGSCCGHGGDGSIRLADGRELVVRRSDSPAGPVGWWSPTGSDLQSQGCLGFLWAGPGRGDRIPVYEADHSGRRHNDA